MRTIFMFSGQGSQYYHMGRKLFDADALFRKHMCELDEVVKSVQGMSVVDELYNPKHKLFDTFLSLRLTHPAIFMAGYALSKTLENQGIVPDFVLGCSLGEFTAAAVSGVLDAEDALRLVLKQAQVIESTCREGMLIAVLQELGAFYENAEINGSSTLAAINAPSQFVIGGDADKLALVKKFMKSKEILHQELMVSYGFHSPAIDVAESSYTPYLLRQKFKEPSIPMISGVKGSKLEYIPDNYFWEVVRHCTIYNKAIQTIENLREEEEELLYVDLGTGSLANLIKYNVKEGSPSKGFQIMTPFQQEIKKMDELKKHYKEQIKEIAIHTPIKKNEPLVAYIFPGQGSQRKGMGEDLFNIFSGLTDKASNILGYSIKELCVADPERNLNKTQYTQPALYVVNALSYLKLKEETGIIPDFVAGHSLGEYNALLVAGGFDFETGLRLVQKRGALMAQMKEGGMAAVKGLSAEEIMDIISRNGLHEIDMANYNTQNQIVLSGPRELIVKSGPFFESAGATLYFPLNVNGAFHSRYMIPAKEAFEQFLAQFTFSSIKIPVVSNVEAKWYPNNNVKTLLAEQLVKPVKWTESITYLMGRGEVTFKEVGPGDVLTKLVWRIQQDMQEVIQ